MTALLDVRARASARPRLGVDAIQSVVLVVIGVLLISVAVAPDLFSPFDPDLEQTSVRLQPPSPDHLFGTDYLGRDLLSRVIHGTGLSVFSALLAVAVGLVLGTVVGLGAGWFGGALDAVLMRVVDALLAVPSLLLSMVLVSGLGFSTVNAAIAVGVGSTASFARLFRSEVFRLKHAAFIEAARLSGSRTRGVLFEHLLPNAIPSVLALSSLQFGSAILSISALAFLGFGSPPPTSEWGLLISTSRDYLNTAPWTLFFPSLVLVLVVLYFNVVSRIIRKKGGVQS